VHIALCYVLFSPPPVGGERELRWTPCGRMDVFRCEMDGWLDGSGVVGQPLGAAPGSSASAVVSFK